MFRVLVTGASGQLGSEIKDVSNNYNYEFYFKDSKTLDINDFNKFNKFVVDNAINVIVNCGAYTAVDKAESEPELANNINHLAIKNIADLSKKYYIKLIHISTDYVFDGKSTRPYVETDKPNPKSVYGKTKLDGELAIQNSNPKDSIIIRTSWVYSKFGNNFVKAMLSLAKERNEINVVSDQVGSPTNAADLADVILNIIPLINNTNVELYHFSNKGACSWYEFSIKIFNILNIKINVNPIKTYQYPTIAKRPGNSTLDTKKIQDTFNVGIINWELSLKKSLKNF